MGGGTIRTCRALETTGLAVCSAVQCQTPSGLWMCGDAHREGVLGRVNKVDERVLGRMGTRDLQLIACLCQEVLARAFID